MSHPEQLGHKLQNTKIKKGFLKVHSVRIRDNLGKQYFSMLVCKCDCRFWIRDWTKICID